MTIIEKEAKSILRNHKRIDSWFLAKYGMNLYRGCLHNCAYCDGRNEKYRVENDFGTSVEVKTNAIEILDRELNPARKRKPITSSYIMLGGGVGDLYQQPERKYNLARQTLMLILKYNYPVHILTKSSLVQRDTDLISAINQKRNAIVSFSISCMDNSISRIFEPGASSPDKRFETMSFFKKQGITSGIFLLPIIPFISDSYELIDKAFQKAKDNGADYIIFGGMTLKPGLQSDYFYNTMENNFPDKFRDMKALYSNNRWGNSSFQYTIDLHKKLYEIAKKHKMPLRIPVYLCSNALSENDSIIVMLDQISYALKIQGIESPYSFAANSISKIDTPLSEIRDELLGIKGVGKATEKLILEYLTTGRLRYYEKLVAFG